jgi:hypothetical protein
MVSQKEKKRMQEYIVEKLRLNEEHVEPRNKNLVDGRAIESSYIVVGDKGLVLLVDQIYPGDCFDNLHRKIVNARDSQGNLQFERFAVVFYKDGKKFFRSSVAGEDGEAGLASMRFKNTYGLSLKHYNAEDLRRIITCRPEEIVALCRSSWLQYYQPVSERLEEGIASYRFAPVHFDYSHLDGTEYRPSNTDSKRLHIWKENHLNKGDLVLDGKKLVPKPEQSR